MDSARHKWNQRYAVDEYVHGREPVALLKEHIERLPAGKALDLAMGEGRNSIYLAERGYEVWGLDISEVGVEKARAWAEEKGLRVHAEVVDLTAHRLAEDEYDLIVMTYYVQRDLFSQVKRSVRPGGVVVIESHTTEYLKQKPSVNPDHLLRGDELLEVFSEFKILFYRRYEENDQARAGLIAERPLSGWNLKGE